jgi:hypothetical protein
MKPQTPQNLINEIFRSREEIFRAAGSEETRSERIVLIYKLADNETKRFLDAIVTELCGKSPKDLLEDSGK